LALFGVCLQLLPHGVRWWNSGDPTWLSDTDELVPYGQIISHSYHQHPWKLGDPAQPQGGASMYPWLQFSPFVLLAKALGIGPLGVMVLMRIWSGITLPIGIYLLFGQRWAGWWGAAATVLLLSDSGGVIPLLDHWPNVVGVLTDRVPPKLHGWSRVLGRLRLITPGVSLFFLTWALWAVSRLRMDSSRRAVLLAGVAFGVLFHVYFYFWTAFGGMLCLLLFLDAERWRSYFQVGLLGGIIGLPAVLASARVKHQFGDEWLVRNEYFAPVTDPQWMIPWRAVAVLTLLAPYIWFRRRDLLPIWLVAVVAVALAQSHVVTRIWLQPNHWGSITGVACAVLLWNLTLDVVVPALRRSSLALGVASLVLIAQMASAAYLRSWTPDHNEESVKIEAGRKEILSLARNHGGLPLSTNAVVAGELRWTDWLVLYRGLRPVTATLGLSPSVKNVEWAQRRVVNAYLKGVPAADLDGSVMKEYGVWFHVEITKPEQLAKERLEYQEMLREVMARPSVWCDRFGIRYLAIKAGQVPPAAAGPWKRVAEDAVLGVWERPVGSGPPSP
jgi:hypothetical protein